MIKLNLKTKFYKNRYTSSIRKHFHKQFVFLALLGAVLCSGSLMALDAGIEEDERVIVSHYDVSSVDKGILLASKSRIKSYPSLRKTLVLVLFGSFISAEAANPYREECPISQQDSWNHQAIEWCVHEYRNNNLAFDKPLRSWSNLLKCEDEESDRRHKLALTLPGRIGTAAKYALAEKYERKGLNTFQEYERQRNYGEYLKLLTEAAEEGCDYAQYRLGRLYMIGYLVPKDERKGLALYKLAIQSPDMPYSAGYVIAAYLTGQYGETKDEELAIKWAKKSTRSDLAEALFRIGEIYQTDTYLPKNLTEARRWFTLAAEKGSAKAQGMLKYLDSGNDSLSAYPVQ